MFRKILVPTDFSHWSDGALALLASLKDCGAREVTLLHVLDTRPFLAWPGLVVDEARIQADAARALDLRRRQVESLGLRAETRLERGAPVETIVRAAAGYDLLLLGARGHSFLHQAVLGSVSENVVRHATIPVLLSKSTAEAAAADRRPLFAHVLFPTDFSPCADKALAVLPDLVSAGTYRVTLLHVQDTRGEASRLSETAECLDMAALERKVDRDRLEDASRQLSALGMDVRVQVCEGLPYREALRVAREEAVTAILLGSHGKSSMAEILLGSVSGEIIRQAQVPVLVIRRDLDEVCA